MSHASKHRGCLFRPNARPKITTTNTQETASRPHCSLAPSHVKHVRRCRRTVRGFRRGTEQEAKGQNISGNQPLYTHTYHTFRRHTHTHAHTTQPAHPHTHTITITQRQQLIHLSMTTSFTAQKNDIETYHQVHFNKYHPCWDGATCCRSADSASRILVPMDKELAPL